MPPHRPPDVSTANCGVEIFPPSCHATHLRTPPPNPTQKIQRDSVIPGAEILMSTFLVDYPGASSRSYRTAPTCAKRSISRRYLTSQHCRKRPKGCCVFVWPMSFCTTASRPLASARRSPWRRSTPPAWKPDTSVAILFVEDAQSSLRSTKTRIIDAGPSWRSSAIAAIT